MCIPYQGSALRTALHKHRDEYQSLHTGISLNYNTLQQRHVTVSYKLRTIMVKRLRNMNIGMKN